MNELFDICVHLLEWFARSIGITYKEANIYIFVIGYPALLVCIVLFYRYKIRLLKRRGLERRKAIEAAREWKVGSGDNQQDNVFHYE